MTKLPYLKKAELITEIANTLSIKPEVLESLEKASYDALSALHEAVSTRCSLGSGTSWLDELESQEVNGIYFDKVAVQSFNYD